MNRCLCGRITSEGAALVVVDSIHHGSNFCGSIADLIRERDGWSKAASDAGMLVLPLTKERDKLRVLAKDLAHSIVAEYGRDGLTEEQSAALARHGIEI